MTDMARGIVHDLRQRKLLPVAALLLVVLIAIPLVGLKSSPATEPPIEPAPTAGSSTSADGLPSPQQALSGNDKPLVSLAVLEQSSDLEEFENKNPFKPVDQLADAGGDQGTGPVGAPQPSDGSGSRDSGSGGGGTGGSGADGTGGGGGGDTTPRPQNPTPAPKDDAPQTQEKLTYAVDLSIRGPKGLRTYRGVPKLSLLPSQDNPLLVFLGVEDAGNSAVFLVDAELDSVGGEGACSPSPDQCATLTLAPGAQHTLANGNGQTWVVSITEIRETSVAKAAEAARKATNRRARKARTADGATTTRRFVPPMIVDLFTGGRS